MVSTSYANGARLAVDECVYAPHIPIDYDWFVEQLRTLPDPVARKLAEHVEVRVRFRDLSLPTDPPPHF